MSDGDFTKEELTFLARLPEKTRVAAKVLLENDTCFVSPNPPTQLCLLVSDCFAYGCADCESIEDSEIEYIEKLNSLFGFYGPLSWAANKRNEKPVARICNNPTFVRVWKLLYPHTLTESSKMKLRPIGNKVLVKLFEAKEKTAGGLYIPTTAQEKTCEGTVVAVGAGRVLPNGILIPMDVKVGDKVYVKRYGGMEVKIEEDTLLLVEADEDILGVIEG